MKVLFLDVDGVINSVRSMTAMHDEYKASYAFTDTYSPKQHCLRNHIDPVAVSLLNRITDHFDVKLCISSTHRKHTPAGVDGTRNLQKMQEYFYDFGLTGQVVGYTPDSSSGFRGAEIAYWLTEHPEVTKYAILDDSDDMLEIQMPYFVCTSALEGMSYKNYKQLMDLFSARKLVAGVDYSEEY